MAIFKRTALVALILLTAAGAFAADNQVSETVLPNGLKVLIKEVHAAPVFTCQVWYRVGSRNEHPGITGISHMVEHMMFKGTKNIGKGQYFRMIRAKGGMNNASTWLDWTNYWEVLSTDHLEMALGMESDRMQNALMDKKEFNSERVVILSEMEGKENEVNTLLYYNMMAVAYQSHSYRWPTIGYDCDLKNITRDQLYKYYKTYYHPNNAVLVIVGDVDTNKTMELVRKYFGKIPRGPEPPKVYTTEKPQLGERRFVLRREGPSEISMIAYHMPNINDPDIFPLLILGQILDGGGSSRLHQSMVESQLATSASASAGLRKDPGLFMLSATGQQNVTAGRLEKALLDEVEKAKTTLPTNEELTRAKNQFEAYLIYQNDSVSDQGENLGYYECETSWKFMDELHPKIEAVTAEDVQRVARKYLTENNRTVGWFVPTAPGGSASGQQAAVLNVEGKYPGTANYQPAKCDLSKATVHKSAAVKSVTPTHPSKSVMPTRVVLKNGIVVIVQENHSNPTVAIRGSIKAGNCMNPPGKEKVACITAASLTRGTNKRSKLDISTELDNLAANAGFSSDLEAVWISGDCLSKDFSQVVDLLSDELRNPSFPQEQLDKIKSELIVDFDKQAQDPGNMSYRNFFRSVYPEGHPARIPTIEEDKKSVMSTTRDDLVSFYKAHYGPETTVIVIVGDIKTDEAVAAIKKCFGDWQPNGTDGNVKLPDLPLAKSRSKTICELMDKSQVNVYFGHAGNLKRSDPDFYATTVMNNILGAGMNGRLSQKVRDEMGLVYSIYSLFDVGLNDGTFFGGFGTNPKNVDKALTAMDEVIRNYIKNGPTQQEFKDSIECTVGSFPLRLETNDGVAGILNAAEFYGLGMDYIQKYPSYYRTVTIDQVRQAAKKHLHPDSMSVSIAGPYKENNQK
ncbi:MAG: pitrilysin family protein [Armatimonadota bacterium]